MEVRPVWRTLLVGLGLISLGSACSKARETEPAASTGPEIVITGASVNGANQVVATYRLTRDGRPLDAASAASMAPAWTLAGLTTNPVSQLPAWVSYLLTGSQTLVSHPIEGPGTPAQYVLTNVKQTGSESNGTVQEQGNGVFTYTFKNTLPPGYDTSRTLRVGVWLNGATGTIRTASTFDFVPNGGTVGVRDLVLDTSCNQCHGIVQAHGRRTGAKLCLTCHTYQLADPDTVDPAAPLTATASTNPNPLDMGRLTHRIHRGKNLPTLYTAGAEPFLPSRNTPLLGQKYSVVGFRSAEEIYGQVVNRTEHNQPAKVVAAGVAYPQDLRNCAACHGGAPQGSEILSDVSRRTCQGCHPDVWFGTTPAPDAVHFAHSEDPRPDDSECTDCHTPNRVTSIHEAPTKSQNWSGLTARIVSVQNLRPGQSPTVVFTLTDRNGTLSPLNAPTPTRDSKSPVARALSRVALTLAGPTAPDYLSAASGGAPITESVPLTSSADAEGKLTYTFTYAIPADATGTWSVSLEARRSATTSSDSWPFTGESLTEYSNNPVQYVDVSSGSSGGGNPVSRRQVVAATSCNSCHQELSLHGALRHDIEYCVMCHNPDATDWNRRPKGGAGNVNLNATFDNIEERSIDFKGMIHRIHTGERTGSAELGRNRPLVIYGFGGSSNFFDEVRFPGDLGQCTLCHQSGTYRIESIPTGARSTVANETATIQHKATGAHASTETRAPPIQSACMGCHDTNAALLHAQGNTVNGVEQCAQCHGQNTGLLSVETVHGLR